MSDDYCEECGEPIPADDQLLEAIAQARADAWDEGHEQALNDYRLHESEWVANPYR